MNRFSELVKHFDKFGYPIGVNYKTLGTYNTLLGVAATLINFSVIVYFSSNRLIDMILHES